MLLDLLSHAVAIADMLHDHLDTRVGCGMCTADH